MTLPDVLIAVAFFGIPLGALGWLYLAERLKWRRLARRLALAAIARAKIARVRAC